LRHIGDAQHTVRAGKGGVGLGALGIESERIVGPRASWPKGNDRGVRAEQSPQFRITWAELGVGEGVGWLLLGRGLVSPRCGLCCPCGVGQRLQSRLDLRFPFVEPRFARLDRLLIEKLVVPEKADRFVAPAQQRIAIEAAAMATRGEDMQLSRDLGPAQGRHIVDAADRELVGTDHGDEGGRRLRRGHLLLLEGRVGLEFEDRIGQVGRIHEETEVGPTGGAVMVVDRVVGPFLVVVAGHGR
jgi:hypothetical protein